MICFKDDLCLSVILQRVPREFADAGAYYNRPIHVALQLWKQPGASTV